MTRKVPIPADSLVREYLPADYTDAYCREVTTVKALSPDEMLIRFWTGQPGWVKSLFRLRNFLVRFVGLKGGEGLDTEAFEKSIREGGTYGLSSVRAKNERETVMLLTDKHLDASLSVYVAEEGAKKRVYAITLVKFRRTLGRVYFFVIRPFHALIVKSMLKRAIKQMLKKTEL